MDEHALKHLEARRQRWLDALSEHGRAVVESAPPLTPERRAVVAGLLTNAAAAQRREAAAQRIRAKGDAA